MTKLHQELIKIAEKVQSLEYALEITAPELTTKTSLEEFGVKIGGKAERVFRTLHRANGGMVTKSRLYQQIYADCAVDDLPNEEVISSWIGTLRKKLKGSRYKIITHNRVGYSLEIEK